MSSAGRKPAHTPVGSRRSRPLPPPAGVARSHADGVCSTARCVCLPARVYRVVASPAMDLDAVAEAVAALPSDWHGAGTVSTSLLKAIVRLTSGRRVESSIETGVGRTTLLLSHISARHTVFAVEGGGSLSKVRASPLLRAEVVTFVERPTQVALPQHHFDAPLDLALLDGPHAYPFPEVEYWSVYPHLRTGALLIVDDIHIPTVNHLFRFIREDEMFSLLDVAGRTAIFERTDRPTFNPLGDGWDRQRFNQRRFPASSSLPLIERAKLMVPEL